MIVGNVVNPTSTVKPVTPIDIGLDDLVKLLIFPRENLPTGISGVLIVVPIPTLFESIVQVIIPVTVLPPPTTPNVVIPAIM